MPRYPTPDELWNLTFAEANAWRDRFAAVPFEDKERVAHRVTLFMEQINQREKTLAFCADAADQFHDREFMEMLFGKLPEFFKDEAELRALWSVPNTRAKLLQGLADKGFGSDQLAQMQKIIDAEKSDLFDVLAHVAYALAPFTGLSAWRFRPAVDGGWECLLVPGTPLTGFLAV